jgi:hypothetical protein
MKIYILCFLTIVNIVNGFNSTDCKYMYLNKTIDTPCFDDSSCCFINYTFSDNTITKCVAKVNQTEDICDDMGNTIGYYGGSLNDCECNCDIFNIPKIILMIFLMLIIF